VPVVNPEQVLGVLALVVHLGNEGVLVNFVGGRGLSLSGSHLKNYSFSAKNGNLPKMRSVGPRGAPGPAREAQSRISC
jgi:hypothetical protein